MILCLFCCFNAFSQGQSGQNTEDSKPGAVEKRPHEMNPESTPREESPELVAPQDQKQTASEHQKKSPSPEEGKPGGQGPGGGMPAAPVAVDNVQKGEITPRSPFIGTVYFDEVSEVATEVGGLVLEADFDEGRNVKKGDPLVLLDSSLLEKSLAAEKSNLEEAKINLEQARTDYERTRKLFQEGNVSEQTFDDARFRVQALQNKVNSLEADVERLQTELDKKTIESPFDGVIIEKEANLGEWVSPGGMVATIAKAGVFDVIVYVPQSILEYIEPGMEVTVMVNNYELSSKVLAIIPKGNVETRSFPVRVRVTGDTKGLLEGMETRVIFPSGKKQKSLLLNRDAIIKKFGQNVIFKVENNVAVMVPVIVVGYEGQMAGVRASELDEGDQVIIKGNERIQDGQPVMPLPPDQQGPDIGSAKKNGKPER